MYKVLFVCTGNICRSPAADGVLRHRISDLGLGDYVSSDSAGTHGYHVGAPPDPRSIQTARGRGVDLSGLRARKFTPNDMNEFDLVLAMDTGHHALLLPHAKPSVRATLKLFLEFAPKFKTQSVPDPYYGGQDGFDLVMDMMECGVDGLIDDLRTSGVIPK